MLRIAWLVLVLSCCLVWIGSAAAAEPKKGDVVVVQFGKKFSLVEVVQPRRGGFIQVRDKEGGSPYSTATFNVVIPEAGYELLTEKSTVKKGEVVRAKWGLDWTNATVVEVSGNHVKVKWDGWNDFHNSEVPKFALARPKSANKESSKEAVSPELAGLAGKRTWTDASGKFKIEASYAGLSDEKVQLKKADGKTISLPLDKLSIADREIAQLLAKSQPAGEPEDVDPFAMAAKEGATEAAEPTTAKEPMPKSTSDDPEYKTLTADWSEAFEVSLRTAGAFNLPADSLTPPAVNFADRSILLTSVPSRGSLIHAGDVIASPSLKRILAVFDEGSHTRSQYRFNLCDTEKGKMLGEYSFPGSYRPLALDETKNRVLTFTEGWPHGANHADLWEINEKNTTLKHLMRWNPVEEVKVGMAPVVRKGFLVGDDHALLIDSQSRFTLWQLSSAKAIYFGQMPSGAGDVKFTPDGKYFMAVVQGTLGIFDVATGKGIGQTNLGSSLGLIWRISPDGKRIATLKGSVQVYDIALGKLLHEVFLPPNAAAKHTLEWAGDSHVLIDSTRLVDLSLGIVAWNYSRAGFTNEYGSSPMKLFGGLFWGIKGDPQSGRCNLICAALPHPGVNNAVAGLDPQKLAVFQPGCKVRLNLQLDSLTEPDRQKVTASLTQALSDVGATVAPDGEMVMTCTSKTGTPRAIAFGQQGFGLRTTVTANTVFTPNIYSLELKDPNGVVWSNNYATSPPAAVVLKPGQTVESFVQEASKPSPDFFLRTKFPQGMKRPGPYQGAYGESQL